jgi:hypothetical protein
MPEASVKRRKIIVHIATSADGYIARPRKGSTASSGS